MFDHVNLTISYEQFIVIHKFLQHCRLGNDNIYRDAISDLAIDLEKAGSEKQISDYIEYMEISEPCFMVEFSEEDGLVFNVDEKE